jgi:hypothetical protein
MTLAMKRLKNIGWLALVFMVAVLLYPLSLNVAALHSDLGRIDSDILETKQQISFLQAEIRTRASVVQLEEWNELLYGYEPPRADQFIDGERGLASLGGAAAGVRPVLVAVETPAGEVGAVGAVASFEDGDADRSARAVDKPNSEQPEPMAASSAPRIAESAKPKRSDVAMPKPPTGATKGNTETRTERLAKIDDKLLSDSLMREIQTKSDKERKKK